MSGSVKNKLLVIGKWLTNPKVVKIMRSRRCNRFRGYGGPGGCKNFNIFTYSNYDDTKLEMSRINNLIHKSYYKPKIIQKQTKIQIFYTDN